MDSRLRGNDGGYTKVSLRGNDGGYAKVSLRGNYGVTVACAAVFVHGIDKLRMADRTYG